MILSLIFSSIPISIAAPLPPEDMPFETIDLPPEAQAAPDDLVVKSRALDNPKLDSTMVSLAAAAQDSTQKAIALARARSLKLSGNRVHVQVLTHAAGLENAIKTMTKAGGEVTGVGNDDTLIQGWLPVDALETVAAQDDVYFIRRPVEVQLFENLRVGNSTTEGLAAINGPAWHTAGYTGSGVKVAIIDGGFTGYNDLLGVDLPASVTVKNFVDGENDSQVDGASPHGTACAEIIHDIVPDATLYLAKVSTNLDLAEAVAWAKDTHGVDIISTSLGWYNLTPGDGTGEFAALVQGARNAGILWITAAGNDREAHWGGLYSDPNSNDVHNFNGTQEINYFGPGDGTPYSIPAGVPLMAFLRWDDWTNVNQDYDMYLLRWNGASWDTIAAGEDVQNGSPGQSPAEFAYAVTSGAGTAYGFAIVRSSSTRNVNLEVFVPKIAPLDELVYARSLANLADAPGAMTVAALDVTSPYPQESYSSEGPTNGPGGAETGGFNKPDISGFANVATESYTGSTFNGTSAATPHVAGAAALALSAYPSYTPDQLQSFLEGRAVDMGSAGTDTLYGYGRLYLGDPPAGANTAPTLSGLPDQSLPANTDLDNAIDLWDYAADAEDADADLTFSIVNSPTPDAGVSIDANRYIDINPAAGWTGQTDVAVQVQDTGGLTDSDTFRVTVSVVADKTWDGSVSSDWHTADNWTPAGVPDSEDDVLVPDVANDPIISTGDAEVGGLTIAQGALLDVTDRTLTVEGTLTNNGTLRQTQDVAQGNGTEFLRITNLAGDQTKYYGLDITPQGNVYVSSREALRPVELTLDSLPARSATPRSAAIYAPDAPVSLVIDDGVHETAYGVNNNTAETGKQFIWLNRFTPEAAVYPFTLDEIWVMFDSFGGGANVSVGDAIDLVVYEDSDGDPSNGATWLAMIPVTVQAVDGTAWSVYSLSSPVLLEDPGDVIIAAINRYIVSGVSPMAYPATVDVTTGQDRSWLGWWSSDPPSPAVLPPDLRFDLMTGDSAGNFLIRGYGSTVTSNTPPILSGLPDQTVPMNGSADNAIDLWAYADDTEDTDADLTFSIVNTPDANADVSIDANRYIDINPTTDWTGQIDVEVQVQDTGGLTDTDIFQVVVTDTVNTAPIISNLPNQWLPVNDVANNAIDLWAYTSDAESPDDALTFSIDNTPAAGAGVRIDSNRYIDIFPETDWTGQTDVVVRVTDPEGLFDTDSFWVTVTSTVNTPPTLSSLPDITVTVNGSLLAPIDLWNYADDAEDSDAALTFDIVNSPDPGAGVAIDSDRYIQVIPTTDWVGVTDVEIQVQDTGGLIDTDVFQVIVTGTVNAAPVISNLPDQEVPVNGFANNAIDLWAFSSDAESPDDALTFSIDNTPVAGAGVRIDSNRYIDIFPETDWTGQTDVVVRVMDPEGLFDTGSFQVTVASDVTATSVTVSISGNQFCAGRTVGVERCFDIDASAPLSAAVRFYFSEAERNGQSLNDLLVLHYDGADWIEEPGPYTRGGAGDAQYVEAQNVDEFSPFALGRSGPTMVYLPLVLRNFWAEYFDDFSDPTSGWAIGEYANVIYRYLNGEYQIYLKREESSFAITPDLVLPSDYRIEVDARRVSSGVCSYGLVFGTRWTADSWETYQVIVWPTDGKFLVNKRTLDSSWTTIQDWTYSSAINQNYGTNRIRVDRIGTIIRIYVNGTMIANITDSSLTGPGRDAGIRAYSYWDAPVDVRFDNFSASQP